MTKPRIIDDEERTRIEKILADLRAAGIIDENARPVCTCAICEHPMARHGSGYVEIEGKRVIVMACLDCPRNACLINAVG